MNPTPRAGRSMPDIVAEAFTICVRHWRAVYVATVVPAALVGLVTAGVAIATNSIGPAGANSSTLNTADSAKLALALAASAYLSLMLYVAAQVAVYPAVTAVMLGRKPSTHLPPGTLADMLRGMAAAAIIVTVAFAISAFTFGFGSPVAVYLGVRWSFAGEEVARGARSPAQALAASWHRVKGTWWRVALITLAIALIGLIPRLVPLPIAAAFDNPGVDVAVYVFGALLAVPFVTVATVVLYVDVLTRKGERLQPLAPTLEGDR